MASPPLHARLSKLRLGRRPCRRIIWQCSLSMAGKQSSIMRAKRVNRWGEAPPHMFVKVLDTTVNALSITIQSLHLIKRTRLSKVRLGRRPRQRFIWQCSLSLAGQRSEQVAGGEAPPLHSRLSKLRHASEASKWLGRSPSAHVCQSSVRAEGPDGGLDVTVNALSITLKSLHLKKRTRLSKASKASKWLGAKPPPPSPPFTSVKVP